MEELENEQDKAIYWIIFFIIIIIIAVLGYYFVYNYNRKDSKKEKTSIVEEPIDTFDYRGTWIITDADETRIQELNINIIDGATIFFDYYIKDLAYFENQTASFDDNTATFTITDRTGEKNIDGRIIFKNSKVFLILSSSNIEDLPLGTFEFMDKVEESELG